RVVAEADAADERGGRRPPARAERLDNRVRRERIELRDVGKIASLHDLAGERRDRERRLLQVLLAKPRRDENLLEPSIAFLSNGLRQDGRHARGEQAERGGAARRTPPVILGRHDLHPRKRTTPRPRRWKMRGANSAASFQSTRGCKFAKCPGGALIFLQQPDVALPST